MHHRQSIPEDVHAREATVLEDFGATHGFEQRQARQDDDPRDEIERMGDETVDNLKRWNS